MKIAEAWAGSAVTKSRHRIDQVSSCRCTQRPSGLELGGLDHAVTASYRSGGFGTVFVN